MSALKFKRFLWIIVLLGLLFAALQYVPPYITYYQLDSAVKNSVRFAAASRRTMDAVRQEVVSKAKELGVTIAPQDIVITQEGSNFILSFAYEWPIDMRLYQDKLTFEVSAIGESFGQ